ncbi:MAG: carbohydrate kinase family protein [Chloroflexi bacterium]|nr:MAG: carbohydrate kinase family protein [Chloroflexota bacterium]
MSSLQVVGMGAMNLDRLYRVDRILLDGEAAVTESASCPGGSAANTIYGLAKLGVRTGFVGAVGADEAGKRLTEDLALVGVDLDHITVKQGVSTGETVCLSDAQGNRSLYGLPGANSHLVDRDMDVVYFNQAQIVHLSSFVDSGQFELQKRLVAQLSPEVRVSLAPGSMYAARGIDQLASILERTHFLFLNRSEMEQLTGQDYAVGARLCRERGCDTVITTLGNIRLERGGHEVLVAAHVLSEEGEHFIVAKAVQDTPPVDTTGAGDAFAAGFLYGFIAGKTTAECGAMAEIMARWCTTRTGARDGLPSAELLLQEYAASCGDQV